MYLAYIHADLNYANIAWTITHKNKLKKVQSKQKHALRTTFNQSKTSSSEPLFLSLNVLIVYQINIFQSVKFMHKICTMPYLSLNRNFSLIDLQFLANTYVTIIKKLYKIFANKSPYKDGLAVLFSFNTIKNKVFH